MKRQILPDDIWTPIHAAFWGLTIGCFLWFDFLWCNATTFTPFSSPELWLNAILLGSVFAIPALLFNARKIQALIIAALAIWLECNIMYSRTYFTAIPLSSYTLVGNLGDFTASVTDSLHWADSGFILIVSLASILAFRHTKSVTARPSVSSSSIYALFIFILAAASISLTASRGGFKAAWKSLENANYHSCRVPMYSPFGALIYDYLSSVEPLTQARILEVDEWFAAHPRIAPDTALHKTIDNIVLVICESLESWPVGLEIEGKEITPNLNALIGDSLSLYAPTVVSQVGAGRSIDAQLLINAGMLPLENGVYSMLQSPRNYCTLNQALHKRNNARSYILTVDKPVTWNQSLVVRNFGFDTIVARDCWINDEKVGARKKLGDRSFMRQITKKMSSGEIWPDGENAFIQIVTYSGHNPFILPPELNDLSLDLEYPEVIENYLTMAHYTDQGLGILISYLKSRPDYDRTLLVITGDHEGLASYRADAAKRCRFVSDRQLTPLIVANALYPGYYGATMGQIDIYPTILQLAGLTSYPWHGMGRSIIDSDAPHIAVTSQGVVEGDPTNLSPSGIEHLRAARHISDIVISNDMIPRITNQK